mgnify:CR=1 FL=1
MKTKSIIIFMGISGTAEKLEINKFYKFFDKIHKVGPSPGPQNATAISPPPKDRYDGRVRTPPKTRMEIFLTSLSGTDVRVW